MRFVLIFALILMAVPVMAQNDQDQMVFWGGTYDEGPFMMTGHGYNLSGGLWSLQYTNFGADQSVNVELAYIADMKSLIGKMDNAFIGVLAGPNADWVDTEEDTLPTITYLNGAAGLIGGYGVFEDFYVWGAAKYKFKLEDSQYTKEGWKAALGLAYNF